MAEPVLLISSDPFLGASVEAVARGRLQVARLDPSRRPVVWPGGPAAGTVVLDVTARQRAVLHAWVRRHHRGPMVVLLKPGERAPSLPPDPAQVVIGRPFRLGELVAVLEDPPVPGPDAPEPAPPSPGPPAPPDTPEPDLPDTREPDPPGTRGPDPPGTREPDLPDTREPDPPDCGAPAWEGSPRGEGAAAAVHSPPGPEWPTARTRLDARRRRRGTRHRALATRLLLGLLVLLVLTGAWLALGLLEAGRDLRVGAAGVRAELAAAEAALADGRTEEAAARVRAT